jgi:rhodanese-related sulfurtransferase
MVRGYRLRISEIMPQVMTNPVAKLVDTAKSEITELTFEEAPAAVSAGALLVDIRDVRELDRDGRIEGAYHCPRGMLEFWIDPDSPYHKPVFAEDRQFIFFCAGAMRSALAAKTAQDMGLKPVAHMLGGFGGWKKAGHPVVTS